MRWILLAPALVLLGALGCFAWLPDRLFADHADAVGRLDLLLAGAAPVEGARRALAAQALVAQEDARLTRRGLPVDGRACARALLANLRAGAVRQGCSTLPMQVAKLALPETRRYQRTVAGKLHQVRLALRLTGQPPERLVGAFFAAMPCGSDLAEGIDACALLWFGHPVEALTEAEAIALATSVQAPARHLRDEASTRARLDLALARLVAVGWMTPARAAEVTAQPVRRDGLHPDLARAASAGRDLGLTAALDDALAAVRHRLGERGEGARLVGLIVDPSTREVLARAGPPGWEARPWEAGSWVKPFCAAGLRELPGLGDDYLLRTEVPLRLPLYDRLLRPWNPGNASHALPERGVPLTWLMKSVNTATLATALYAYVYMPPAAMRAHLERTLSPEELRRGDTPRDRALSLQLASAYAGIALGPDDVPDLPGYRALSLSAVRTCIGRMRREVPSLEVPQEDLAALLGVVRAPLTELATGLGALWWEDGAVSGLGRHMAQAGTEGTLSTTVARLGRPVPYKTATAQRNAGLAALLADGRGHPRLVVLALAREDGGPIGRLSSADLAPGLLALETSGVVGSGGPVARTP